MAEHDDVGCSESTQTRTTCGQCGGNIDPAHVGLFRDDDVGPLCDGCWQDYNMQQYWDEVFLHEGFPL